LKVSRFFGGSRAGVHVSPRRRARRPIILHPESGRYYTDCVQTS